MARLTAPRSLLLASLIAAVAAATVVPGRAPAADAPAMPLSRGEYLTHGAGQCEDCHGAGLVGAPMPPGPPGVPWAKTAPSLHGLTMFATDADAIAFLETAKLPNGQHTLPPMPHYNFNAADATAIVAYLRALK
jgi:mono/diheme cytochrome c family protein